jgi:hypothetical protein
LLVIPGLIGLALLLPAFEQAINIQIAMGIKIHFLFIGCNLVVLLNYTPAFLSTANVF